MKCNIQKRLLTGLLCLVMLLSLLSGCGSTAVSSSAAVSAAASTSAANGTKEITDMLGNTVTVPAEITKVFCTSPIGTYMMYTLAPDKMLGWNSKLSDDEKQYIATDYQGLPVLGGTMGGQNTFNTEEITALDPDIILDFTYQGQVSDMVTQLGEQTGIPVVELDSGLTAIPESYRTLSKILGVEERGEKLASYAEKTLNSVADMVAKVPDSKRATIYYVESADGLSTDGNDSMHTEVISFVNALNVVDLDTSGSGKGTTVSMEQVLNWNPQVIVANAKMGGTDFLASVYDNPTWASISAVQNHRIYVPASLPFNWFDRPPCIARVLGVEWLASKLYPDYVNVDLTGDVEAFYQLFYGVQITDAQAAELIGD